MKRLLAMLLLVGMLFAVLPAHAAETVIQDGIKVTLITDKDSYEADEWINAQLDIQNTSNYPIKNVRTSIVAPEGYMLLNGSYAEYAELSAGQSYIYKNSMTAAPEEPVVIPQTGDDSHIGLWVLLASVSFVAFCVLSVKNRKAGRMMSMLLCVVLVGTLMPGSVPAKADVVTKSIVVTKTVAIGGQTAIVKGIVTYDYEVEPATFKAGDFVCTYDETGKGVMILEYVGAAKDITVPAVINGMPVTSIATDAFDGHDGITLHVGAGSVAENYAQNMGIPYVVIGATPAPAATATPTVNPTATPTATSTATPTPTPTVTPEPTPTWNPTAAWHFEYEIVDGKCIITGYDQTVSRLVVPETIEGYPVTEIAPGAFSITESDVELGSSSYIYNAVLPETVTVIGGSAFSQQRYLGKIWLPDSLTTIGNSVFNCNISMEQITIPKNVTSIGGNPFIYMYGFEHSRLKTINVDPENPVFATIDGSLINKQTQTLITYPNAFNKDVYTIPVGVKTIGFAAFRRAELKKVIIPDYVEVIEDWAFMDCENLTSLYIPASVKQIEDEAISHWNKNLVIYGVKGSRAETYAKEKGIPFQVLEEVPGEHGPCDGTNHIVAKYTYNRKHPHQFVTICSCGAETPEPYYANGAAYNCCECIGHSWSDMYYIDNKGYAQSCEYCGERIIITPSQGQFMGYIFEEYRKTSMNDLFERTALNATNKMTEAGFTYINETINTTSDISGSIVDATIEVLSGTETRDKKMTAEWEHLITQMLVSDFRASNSDDSDQSSLLNGIDTLKDVEEGISWINKLNELAKKYNLNYFDMKLQSDREATYKYIFELREKKNLTQAETNWLNQLLEDEEKLTKISEAAYKASEALKTAGDVLENVVKVIDTVSALSEEYEKQKIYAQIALFYDEQMRKLDCIENAAAAMENTPLLIAAGNIKVRLTQQMKNSLADELYALDELVMTSIIETIKTAATKKVGDLLENAAPPVKVIEIVGKTADWLLKWDAAYEKGFELQTLGLMNNAIRSEVADVFYEDVDAAYYLSELYTLLQIQGMNCSLEYLEAYEAANGLSVKEFGVTDLNAVYSTVNSKIDQLTESQKVLNDIYNNYWTSTAQ